MNSNQKPFRSPYTRDFRKPSLTHSASPQRPVLPERTVEFKTDREAYWPWVLRFDYSQGYCAIHSSTNQVVPFDLKNKEAHMEKAAARVQQMNMKNEAEVKTKEKQHVR